jgi:AcrR family transcriptional regulator
MSDDPSLERDGRMKKNPEATTLTREALIEAFWTLYCQKRIDHISIKEITDKAGYHRSTFYEYFADIYDLLTQLEESLLTHIKETVLNSLLAERNEDSLQVIVEAYESKGMYLSVLLGENGGSTFSRKLKALMQPALREVFGLSESDIHTAYILEFGLSAILSTVSYWYQSNKDLPSNEFVSFMRAMLKNGAFPMIQQYSTGSFERRLC